MWAAAVALTAAVIEVLVIIQVDHLVGLVPTLALLAAVAVLGAAVCRREGMAAVGHVLADIQGWRMPGSSLLDGFWGLMAGMLLIVPGFVTAALGLVLLLPPVRAAARRATQATLLRRFAGRTVRP